MLDKAAGDVDKLTKAQDRSTASTKKLGDEQSNASKKVKTFRQEYNDLLKELERGDHNYDSTIFNLKRFSGEVDNLARSVFRGNRQAASELNALAREADRVAEDVKTAEKSKETSTIQGIAKRVAAEKQLTAEVEREMKSREAFEVASEKRAARAERDRQAALEQEVNDRIEAAVRATNARKKAEGEDEAVRQRRLAAEKKSAERETVDFINGLIKREKESKAAATRLADFEIGETARVEAARADFRRRRVEPEPQQARRGFLSRLFGIDDDRLDAINTRIKDFEASSNRGGFSAVRLAGNLRGLVIVGILGFFQQLVSVGGALGATLIEIAASAGQAAIALAGMATTGAAQAIPVIVLLAAAWGRVGAVFKVVQQHQLAVTGAANDNRMAMDRQRSAAQQVTSAAQGLADANHSVAQAEQAVGKARKDGQRQLEDLMAAQRQAQLQAESAVLAQSDAQRSLRRSIATGAFGDLAQQSLQARSAREDVRSSRTRATRATQDVQAAGGSVENLESVKSAERALDDASRSADRASQALANAKRAAAEAVDNVGSAQTKLSELIAQLSPAERGLYVALLRIRATYRRTFTGPGGVVESIVNAFTYAVNRANDLLQDSRILRSAHRLADEIGTQIERVVDFLSSGENINFFARMADEAAHNLPAVVSIIENIWTILRNIADAGRVAFRRFLDFIGDITSNAADATSGEGGLAKLEQFFIRGERYAESWIKLFGAVFKLIGALIGSSAQEGTNAIDDFTKQVDKATRYIQTHQKQVRAFFRDARLASYEVAGAIWALTKALAAIYHPDQVRTLARAFEKGLLPALVNVLTVVGAIAELFLKFTGTDIGGSIVELLITSFLLRRALTPLVALFSRLFIFLGTVAGSARLVGAGLTILRVATGPLGIAISALAAILLLFHHRLHGFGDYLKTFGIILGTITVYIIGRGGLVGALATLTKALEAMAGASMLSKLGRLGTVLGGIFSGAGGLLRKLPGVGKLLGEAGTAKRGADFLDVAESAEKGGSRMGLLMGGAASRALMGVLKKAGWIGLGISAAQGIISGFKHHDVNAGVQDFLHSVTFGLVKSADEAAKEAYRRQVNRINQGRPIQRSTGTHTAGLPDIAPPTGPAIPRGPSNAPIAARDRAGGGGMTQDERDWDALSDAQKKVLTGIENLRGRVRQFRREVYTESGYTFLKAQLDKFVEAHPEAERAIDRLEARLDRFKKKMDRQFALENVTFNFGLALQADNVDVGKVTNDLIKNIARLPKSSRHHAEQAAIQMAEGLEAKGKLPKGSAEKIRDDIVRAMQQMRTRAARRAAGTASDTATALNALATVVSIQFSDVVTNVNSVLDALGVKKVHFPKLTKTNVNQYAKQAGQQAGTIAGIVGGLIGSGSATGGWVGRQGERGRDSLSNVVGGSPTGRGEAVLNWAHQNMVGPAMAFTKRMTGYGYASLDEMFRSVRGEHAGGMAGGRSDGGYVQGARAPSGPNSGAIRSLLSQLFKDGYKVTSGGEYRGTGTLHDQQAAADFGNSVNNLVSLARVLWPMRRRFNELFMPIGPPGGPVPHGGLYHFGQAFQDAGLQADHNDHIHVGILGRAAGKLRGIANLAAAAAAATVEKLRMPKITGEGAAADLARGAVKKLISGANAKIARADTGYGATAGPAPVGGIMNIAKHAAQVVGMSWGPAAAATIKRLLGAESGGGKNLPPSGPLSATGPFQVIPGTFAAYHLRGHGNIRRVWDNALAAMNYIKARYHSIAGLEATVHPHLGYPGYELGGSVPGRGPVATVLHGGEHIWTAAEVLRAGGHGVMKAMRKMLGGGGQGRGSYQQGGGVYTEPTIHGTNVLGVASEINRAQSIISRLPTRLINAKATDRLTKSIGELTRSGGLFDQLTEAVQANIDRMGVALKTATYMVTKTGNVIKRLDPVQVADRSLQNLQSSYRDLIGERGEIQNSLDDVAKRLKSSGLSKGEHNRLVGLQRALKKRRDDIASSIADNVESQYQAAEDAISARADKAGTTASLATGKLDLLQRAKDFVGGTAASAMGFPTGGQIGGTRASILGSQAAELTKAMDMANKQGHTDTAKQLEAQIADLKMQAIEALGQGIQADVDEVNRQFSRRAGAIDLRGRVATVLGRVGDLQQVAVDRIQSTTDQIGELVKQRDAANAVGATGIAETINDQISDLQTSITEMAAQQLQDSIDQVNNAASRRGAQLDLLGRVADLRERAGDAQGAFAQRGDILNQRAASMASQRNALYGLLTQAQDQGNQGQVEKLTDQIAELDVSLQENTAELHSNTVQARQAAIDAITARGGFLGGVFGGLQGLLTALGELTGTTDTAGIRSLLTKQGTTLGQTGTGLASKLFEGFGVDVRGLSPAQMVQTLSGLNFDQLETNMAPDDKQQFEGLINSIIENTTAQTSNTQQLKQLNAPTSQSFSSTAWQWFRNAIFNGAGGLLPMYGAPLSTGDWSYSGIATNPSAYRVASANSMQHAGGGNLDAKVFVTEQVEEANPDAISERLMNRWKTRPKA